MLDAKTFLTKGGQKGPQLTVLPPGQYRYNPRLFTITQAPCIDIKIGHVGVVRANAGLPTSNVVNTVNGVALVPPGHKGLWAIPLMPGQYYMHPSAYEVIPVSVAKRVYSYTSAIGPEANTSNAKEPDGDNSIQVRTMDGYRIPVDVRVAVSIPATNAPFVVARLGNPDALIKGSAKHDFDALEERSILPSLRAILRNSAEKQNAIEYVSARSTVEKSAATLFAADMAKDQLVPEGFWLADIKIDASEEGKALLKTQTDKQLAEKQSAMYESQVAAETKRGEQVKAMAMADMQKQIQESLAKILVASNAMAATEMENKGKATESLVYEAKVKAMGGTDAMTKLELMKMMIETAPKLGETIRGIQLPQVVVLGAAGKDGQVQGADMGTALLATLTSLMAHTDKAVDFQMKAAAAGAAPAPVKK